MTPTTTGAIVIAGEDGFLASLLPENGLRVQFDLGLVWSSASGLSLRGSAGMEAVVPVGRSVGPLTLATVSLALRADASGVNASVAGDMSANVGPIRALIAGLGIEAAARANGLAFIPLATERLDLITYRRDAFEPPLQALLAWARTPEFAAQATSLGGYNVANTGRVVFNA